MQFRPLAPTARDRFPNYLTALLVAVAAALLAVAVPAEALAEDAAATAKKDRQKQRGPLRHVVLFKFVDDAPDEKVQAVEKAFAGLEQSIDQIADFEWGRLVGEGKKAHGFTHCFVVTFDDAQGRDAYLPHPKHKEFVSLVKGLLDEVLVVDYFAKQAKSNEQLRSKVLRHLVLFKFKEGATKQDKKAVAAGIAKFPAQMEQVKAVEWGKDVSVEGKSAGFTHAFLISFDSEKDLQEYGPHPVHQALVNKLGPVVEDALSFDFWYGD